MDHLSPDLDSPHAGLRRPRAAPVALRATADASLPLISKTARMAAVLEDRFGGGGGVTEEDLLAAGYSPAEIRAEFPAAKALARSRFVRQVSPRAVGLGQSEGAASLDNPHHPAHQMAELILQGWRAGKHSAPHDLHDAFCGSGLCAGQVIEHYWEAVQLAIRWRDLQDGAWKADRRYREAVARTVIFSRPLRQSIDPGCAA